MQLRVTQAAPRAEALRDIAARQIEVLLAGNPLEGDERAQLRSAAMRIARGPLLRSLLDELEFEAPVQRPRFTGTGTVRTRPNGKP